MRCSDRESCNARGQPASRDEKPDSGDPRHRISRQREDDAHQRRAALSAACEDGGGGQRVRRGRISTTSYSPAVPIPWSFSRTAAFAAPFAAIWSGRSTRSIIRDSAGEIPAFDNVVIETSGLAEPGPVLQAFLSEPTLDGLYRVASVLTLVDAVNWAGTSEAHDESVRQVALADQIRITKLDMVNGDRQNRSSRILLDLRRVNASAEIDGGRLVGGGGGEAADVSRDSTRRTPKRTPVPWLNVRAYQERLTTMALGDDHDHHDHDHSIMRTASILKAEASRISFSRARALLRARKPSFCWTELRRTSEQAFCA